VRAFDARTTSTREADMMREIGSLQRAAEREPARQAELFEAACALLPPLPLKVQIQTTTRCNAACAMCPYPVVTQEPDFEHAVMSEERFLRILGDLRQGGVERLSLFLMNEPLLDRRLPRWLRRAREALPDCVLGLFTNGAALDGRRARELAEAGLDELCVSVHGYDAATYERVMAGLSYARTRRNLDEVLEAAEAGQLGGMRIQLVTGDVPEVAATRELAPLRYRGRIVLKAFSNERTAVGVAPGMSTTDRETVSRGVTVSATRVGGDGGEACQRPFVKLYILTTGDCVLCNVDWRRTVLLGRVGDRDGPSVADVWRGGPCTAVRREQFTRNFVRASICSRCDYAQVVDRE
jgi:hypothetical protein